MSAVLGYDCVVLQEQIRGCHTFLNTYKWLTDSFVLVSIIDIFLLFVTSGFIYVFLILHRTFLLKTIGLSCVPHGLKH